MVLRKIFKSNTDEKISALDARLKYLCKDEAAQNRLVSWDDFKIALKELGHPKSLDETYALNQIGCALATAANHGKVNVYVRMESDKDRYLKHAGAYYAQSKNGLLNKGFPSPEAILLEPHGLIFRMQDFVNAVRDSVVPLTPRMKVRVFLSPLNDLYTPVTKALESVQAASSVHPVSFTRETRSEQKNNLG